VLAFAVNDASGQAPFLVAGALIEIRLLHRFKAARRLEDHLSHRANAAKVQAVGEDAVDADVADHQHAQVPFAFRFGTHQSRQHVYIPAVRFYNGHCFTSSENSHLQYTDGTPVGECPANFLLAPPSPAAKKHASQQLCEARLSFHEK
jgi:hypothetical protein